MSTVSAAPVQLGVANSQSIIVTPNPNALMADLVTCVLDFDYARNAPPGWPLHTPPGDEISKAKTIGNPVTITAGTTIVVSAIEAAALVAAGVAS